MISPRVTETHRAGHPHEAPPTRAMTTVERVRASLLVKGTPDAKPEKLH